MGYRRWKSQAEVGMARPWWICFVAALVVVSASAEPHHNREQELNAALPVLGNDPALAKPLAQLDAALDHMAIHDEQLQRLPTVQKRPPLQKQQPLLGASQGTGSGSGSGEPRQGYPAPPLNPNATCPSLGNPCPNTTNSTTPPLANSSSIEADEMLDSTLLQDLEVE